MLAVICLFESVYRQAQATLPTLVVNKIRHLCKFSLYGLKNCNFNFLFDVFHDLFCLGIAEKMILVWAKETQMLAMLAARACFPCGPRRPVIYACE